MIAAIIQARMGSTRLPGKVLLDLAGKPVLWHVVNRVSKSTLVNCILVATTTERDDDIIEEFCQINQIDVFRGPSEDVLKRYADAARTMKEKGNDLRYIVRITADCPLIDSEIIDLVIIKAVDGNYDYTSNTLEPTYPDGLDVEVISVAALNEADEHAHLPSEREHVTPYIVTHPGFRKLNIINDVDLSSLRWTLDTIEDYIFIQKIYEGLSNVPDIFFLQGILNFLNNHPDLQQINADIRRNEGYQKSLRKDQKFKR